MFLSTSAEGEAFEWSEIQDYFQFQATVDLDTDQPVATPVRAPQGRRNRLPMTGDIVAFP